MIPKNLNKFFLSIVLPSIFTIGLFIVSFYVFLLPSFKQNMMNGKKEMISELTNTAWSLVDEFYKEYDAGSISKEEAMKMAASRVGMMRYGDEKKDYFWITDMSPKMVMHPYRTDLNQTNLENYQDPQGTKLFVDAVRVVQESGEGYIDYIWQWKDDSTQLVPKLSYVKGFTEWNWIIGTGIYLEDVAEEVFILQKRLFRIVFIIIILLALVLLYLVRQSMSIENLRRKAENDLKLSRLKYKTLVESSTIGTVMMAENRVVYANHKFVSLMGLNESDLKTKTLENLFNLNWAEMVQSIFDPKKSVNFETSLLIGNINAELMLSVSKVEYNNGYSYIIVVNELSLSNLNEKIERKVSNELQTALLLMNQPIRNLISDFISGDMQMNASEAISIMKRKGETVIFIEQKQQVIGVVTPNDFLNRLPQNNEIYSTEISTVMTAPVISVSENSSMGEALFICQSKNISNLLVKNENGQAIGKVSYQTLFAHQHNYITQLFWEVSSAETVSVLKSVYQRLTVMVSLLTESGAKSNSITHLISSLADKITIRIVELALEKEGTAPCEFCFIAMGSQGRMEQTLTTDQDNGIIISDKAKRNQTELDYFLKLGKRINESLNAVGYRYCDGNFMAGNPQWNTTLSGWKKHFSTWVNNSDSQSLIDINIFFDFKPLYGDFSLAEELRNFLFEVTKNEAVFFYHLSQEIHRFKSPIGLFGRIQGEHERAHDNLIDIKKLIMPLSSFSRLYSLKAGINETNTLARFKLLKNTEGISQVMVSEVLEAYEVLMKARLKSQLNAISKGENASNVLNINELNSIEQSGIKKALSIINDVVTKVKLDFKVIA